MAGVEALYRYYGVLADAGDKAGECKEAFEGLLASAKGTGAEKRLAPSFITKFSCFFPSMSDTVMNVLLDLVEDDEPLVRQPAIKCLSDMCKASEDGSLCTRVADVLTQLLVSEDATDIGLVKSAMTTVLLHNTPCALNGIFDQILGEDETVREKAIEYVSVSLMDMKHKLFIPKEENEKCLLELIKKVLGDVTADEFETFVDMLGKLHHLQTPAGINTIIDVISEQAELEGDFQSDGEPVDRYITCSRLALKYCKKGGSFYPFLRYACLQILPVFSSITDEQSQQSVLQLLAEGSYYVQSTDSISECLPFLYAFLLEHVPLPPEEGASESPKLHFSVVECVLFAFHQLLKKCPEFFAGPENEERFKEFRTRLQYFARGSQTYHNQLQAALKGKNALELKEEQNKLRQVGLKTTANLNALIKDFFRNPPTYNTIVQLSWGVKKAEPGTKRPQVKATPTSSEGPPVKRKVSPIRFDDTSEGGGAKGKGGATPRGQRKETRAIYHPPRDQYSQKVTNGSFDESPRPAWRGGGRGGRRGRGGGRGNRGGRGFRRNYNYY